MVTIGNKMNEEKRYIGNSRIHCWKCGRFVGKDGFIDISYDDYMGGYEEGYSLCARCLREKVKNKNSIQMG